MNPKKSEQKLHISYIHLLLKLNVGQSPRLVNMHCVGPWMQPSASIHYIPVNILGLYNSIDVEDLYLKIDKKINTVRGIIGVNNASHVMWPMCLLFSGCLSM